MLEMGRESAVQAPTSSLPHHSDSQRREMLSGTLRQLPPELLCVIMSYLPLEDIMSLKRSCKPLSRMVCEPALRSYHSRMREAGLRDRPPPDGLSIRKRLMALDRWESAWDDAHKSIVTDPMTQKQQRQVIKIADGDPDSRMLVVEGFYVEMDPLADGHGTAADINTLTLVYRRCHGRTCARRSMSLDSALASCVTHSLSSMICSRYLSSMWIAAASWSSHY